MKKPSGLTTIHYADIPPTGYTLREFRGGAAEFGDIAFHSAGCWTPVRHGQNIIGADAHSLFYGGIIAIAKPKPKPKPSTHSKL